MFENEFNFKIYFENELTDAQEGDPKYLAPEILKGIFTRQADVFSLGVTILELATDLDVPRSGVTWHQLRLGIIPTDIKHNLGKELVDIIAQMINPNYTQRPTIDEILQMPIVDSIVNQRKEEIIQIKIISLVQKACRYFMNFFSPIWYFLL